MANTKILPRKQQKPQSPKGAIINRTAIPMGVVVAREKRKSKGL